MSALGGWMMAFTDYFDPWPSIWPPLALYDRGILCRGDKASDLTRHTQAGGYCAEHERREWKGSLTCVGKDIVPTLTYTCLWSYLTTLKFYESFHQPSKVVLNHTYANFVHLLHTQTHIHWNRLEVLTTGPGSPFCPLDPANRENWVGGTSQLRKPSVAGGVAVL